MEEALDAVYCLIQSFSFVEVRAQSTMTHFPRGRAKRQARAAGRRPKATSRPQSRQIKHAQRYLAEFEYWFNRLFDLPDIVPRPTYATLRTSPMPERLFKLRLA